MLLVRATLWRRGVGPVCSRRARELKVLTRTRPDSLWRAAGWTNALNDQCLDAAVRSQLVRVASECLATAANPAKGGFVREALINSYPKLAALMEDTLHKIRRDSEVPFVPAWQRCWP